MKYLKKFNEAIDLIENQFEPIDNDEYMIKVFGSLDDQLLDESDEVFFYMEKNWDRFTNAEIKRIKKVISNPDEIEFNDNGKALEIEGVRIIKLKDEWFYVLDNYGPEVFYKCDQIDGLISLLKEMEL